MSGRGRDGGSSGPRVDNATRLSRKTIRRPDQLWAQTSLETFQQCLRFCDFTSSRGKSGFSRAPCSKPGLGSAHLLSRHPHAY